MKFPLDINSIPWYPATLPPPIPKFLIALLTKDNDIVFDPFGGKGTTAIEAIKQNRRFCYNDLNPYAVDIITEMVNIIKSYHKTAVFHRAIDCVNDIDESMNILITIGVDRILTSGLQAKATHGKEMIKYLQEAYGNSIEILAGSGINALNAKKLMDYTGISQVHSSCKDWLLDSTTSRDEVDFSYHGDEYDVVSYELVENLVDIVEDE